MPASKRRQLEDGESLGHTWVRVPSKQNADKQQDEAFLRCSTGLLPELQYFHQPEDGKDLRPSGQDGGDHKAAISLKNKS